jgi:hypothetical protein
VASQSDALKTARTTLYNQRADIDRLRTALESGSGGGLRGIGKPDARTLAESQRLSAELSKVHEELERARASAEENMLLRRELSRLAAQILNVARTQTAAQQHKGVGGAQVYTQPTAVEVPEVPLEPEPTWEPTHVGNGAARQEQDEAEVGNEVDTVAAGMAAVHDEYQDAPLEAYADEVESESESEQQKGSFAQRFVARREARRSGKSGGRSLGDRLRGLVADRPET